MEYFAFPDGTPSTLSFSRNGSILIAGGGRGGKTWESHWLGGQDRKKGI
ncbi:MAG: hypothetical protein ACJ0IB_09780 [Verrucomicrobiales bacterium]